VLGTGQLLAAMSDDRALVAQAQTDDDTPADMLIARYLAGVELLRDATADMDRSQLTAYPVPGRMSTLEVICHIVDADQFMADRMKRTIATDRPLLMGVESVDYIEPLHYFERDPGLDMRLLGVTREQMAADLQRLDARMWQRTAVHSENGLVTLRQLLLHTIRHLERHVAAIHEKRAALGL
jgi:hypothetical protein